MLRLTGVFLAIVGFMSASAAIAAEASKEHPNIILILSDDVGLGDIGSYGGPFKTPNIDAMAKGGTQFTYCYASPLCGPSRCQLLTGRYPFRTGHNSNQSKAAIESKKEVMIPTVLKKAGYVSAQVGKWGQLPYTPGEWGFDEYLVYPGSGRFWRAQTTTYNLNGKQVEVGEDEYIPETMHKFATDFIDDHKDERFFLFYSMSHMHGPIVRTPESKKGADKDQLYTDNVEYMDKLVGKLLKELDDRSLRENTLVIFTGDNGTAMFGEKLATVHGKSISGKKGSVLEGGSRVPFIASWPGTTPAGKVNNDLTDFSDFFASFADLAGAEEPEGVKIDGVSFAPQLRGAKGEPREWVYVELNGRSYVRDAKYKLTAGGEMFDLSNAPYEEIPVAADTKDEGAQAARKSLQLVLDEHKMAPFKEQAEKKKQRKRARARRNAAA